MLVGDLPGRALKMVKEWLEHNRDALLEIWKTQKFLELPPQTINGLFQQVKVDAGGFGISWNDEIDLASEELRINGKEK